MITIETQIELRCSYCGGELEGFSDDGKTLWLYPCETCLGKEKKEEVKEAP